MPEPRRRRTTRTTSPPNTVMPGWTHDALAAVTLNLLRARTDGKLNVGEFADDFMSRVPGAVDGPEPAVLLSRIYAHVGHRLPLVKRIEKRLEGRDSRAGIGSDVLALAAQLYLRNRELFADAVILARESAQRRGKNDGEPPAANNGDGPAPPVPFHVQEGVTQ